MAKDGNFQDPSAGADEREEEDTDNFLSGSLLDSPVQGSHQSVPVATQAPSDPRTRLVGFEGISGFQLDSGYPGQRQGLDRAQVQFDTRVQAHQGPALLWPQDGQAQAQTIPFVPGIGMLGVAGFQTNFEFQGEHASLDQANVQFFNQAGQGQQVPALVWPQGGQALAQTFPFPRTGMVGSFTGNSGLQLNSQYQVQYQSLNQDQVQYFSQDQAHQNLAQTEQDLASDEAFAWDLAKDEAQEAYALARDQALGDTRVLARSQPRAIGQPRSRTQARARAQSVPRSHAQVQFQAQFPVQSPQAQFQGQASHSAPAGTLHIIDDLFEMLPQVSPRGRRSRRPSSGGVRKR